MIWNIPKYYVKAIARLGDFLHLPLNSERLKKLTETYIVSNSKIKIAINKSLPISAKVGFIKTFESFKQISYFKYVLNINNYEQSRNTSSYNLEWY